MKTYKEIKEIVDFLMHEFGIVMKTATPIVISIYVKRAIEHMIGAKVVDEKIVREGMQATPSTTPSTATFTNGTAPMTTVQQGSLYRSFTPTGKSGPGVTWVRDVGRIVYRTKWRTDDGYDIYDHDEKLHPLQEVDCPMLLNHGCHECKFYTRRPKYQWESNCAPYVWLHELRETDKEQYGLEAFQDQLM